MKLTTTFEVLLDLQNRNRNVETHIFRKMKSREDYGMCNEGRTKRAMT